MILKRATTSYTHPVFAQDTTSPIGAGKTGLVFNTATLVCYYKRELGTAAVSVTLATMTLGTWATGGFIQVSSANMPGLYDFGVPNAAIDGSDASKWVEFMFTGIAGVFIAPIRIDLEAVDRQDAAAFGLSRLDAAVTSRLASANLVVDTGTATAGAASTITLKVGSSAVNDFYKNETIFITGGTGAGQSNLISSYVGATRVATVSTAWATQPDATSTYAILALGSGSGGGGGLDAAGVRAAVGLASANLDTQLTTIDDFLDTEVAAILAAVDTEVAAIKTKTDQLTFGTANRVDAQVFGIQAGAITAAAIATDAIDADALAADAVTEIQSGLATAAALDAVDNFVDTEVAAILAAVDTEVAAIKTKTDQLVFSTANRVDAQVFGMEASTVTAAAIATDAIDADALKADALTEIQSGLATAAALDAVDNFIDTEIATIITNLATAQTAIDDIPTNAELATSQAAADDATLAAIAALNNLSAAAAAAAVWNEDATGHQTQGTFGQAIGDPVADTDTIFGLLNTNLNATISSRASQTSVDTIDDFLDTEIAAIKAKTDNLPTDPADESLLEAAITAATAPLATAAALTIVDDFVDTEVAAILAAVDTEVAAIKAKTDQLIFTTANRVDSQVFGMQAGTVTAAAIATDAIDNDAIAATAVTELQSGLATSAALATLQTSVDDIPTNAELTTALAAADDAVLAAIAALNNLSAAGVRTAIGLATANLDTQLDALPTNAELSIALGTADDAVLAAVAALNNLSAAQVNAEMLDVLAVDTFAEPGAIPDATASLKDKIGFLALLVRNRITQTATTTTVFADDGVTPVATFSESDNGTTLVVGEGA